MVELFANSEDPDQMLHSAASDLGLQFLLITRLGVSPLQWVKTLSGAVPTFLFFYSMTYPCTASIL